MAPFRETHYKTSLTDIPSSLSVFYGVPMAHSPTCPACSNAALSSLLFYKNSIPVYKCSVCGLGMAAPEEFDPSKYYNEAYFNGGKADGYSDYVQTKKTLQAQFAREFRLLKEMQPQGGKLLELGCAYGYFLEVARQHYQVYGLELCEEAVADCQARGLAEVRQGPINKENLLSVPTVDIVVMLDVIEHLSDPLSSLSEATAKLRPGGILLLTTGDFASLCARITGKYWRLMTPPQHLWFFTPTAIKMLGEKLGLECLSITHPFKKVPLSLMCYQMCRFLSLQPRLPKWTQRASMPVNLFDAMRVVMRKKV